MVVRFLFQWKALANPTSGFSSSPAHWRSLFNEALKALKLEKFLFRPYSLRRGGATWWFTRHHSLDQILLQGRWQAPRTARIYLNEGLAVLAEMQLPRTLPSLSPFLFIFHRYHTTHLLTLEPPRKSRGRTGGRGKGPKKAMKAMKKAGKTFPWVHFSIFHVCLFDFNPDFLEWRVWLISKKRVIQVSNGFGRTHLQAQVFCLTILLLFIN